MSQSPLYSPLLPYTTLFRSARAAAEDSTAHRAPHEIQRIRGLPPRSKTRRADDRVLRRLSRRSRAHAAREGRADRKSTRLNSSHTVISYAVFCLKKKNNISE